MGYTFSEYADMILMYGLASCNALEARRLYEERYPNRNIPNQKTFQRLDQRLRDTGGLFQLISSTEMESPYWINKELLKVSLITYFQDESVVVSKYSCEQANPAGSNYTTMVFRVNVQYTNKSTYNGSVQNISIIIKCAHEGGIMQTFAKELELYEKEADMCSNILPKMNQMQDEKETFSADFIKFTTKPLPTLLLKDLCSIGYKVLERRCGLNMDQTLAVLRKLASFHASSVVMRQQRPNILPQMYFKGLFQDKDICIQWITLCYDAFKDASQRWPECEKYRALLPNNTSEFVERCLKSLNIEEGDFTVLNHGDMWSNNIMFNCDNQGITEDCKLIDYQLSVLGSPAIDLHYFFATSLADNIRKDINYFLDYYYEHLLSTFIKLKYSVSTAPTRNRFREDFRRRVFYGLLGMVTVLPLVRAEAREDAGFEELFGNNDITGFRYHIYNNNVYKSGVISLLPYYEKLGAFSS